MWEYLHNAAKCACKERRRGFSNRSCVDAVLSVSIRKQNHFIWPSKTEDLFTTVKTGQRRVDPSAVIFIRQRQNQTGNGQQAKTGISEAEQRHKQYQAGVEAITGISEAEQRRKQYQAGVEVTSTGSEFQGKAVRGQTQK